jgi:hypothetical protein
LAGLHELMGNLIGLNDTRPQCREHLSHDGFSRGDAAGETDFEHKEI